MEDIKSIIAENITLLRKGSGMTQIELAEKLNYSDKSVSKWERGESVPDIAVLKQMADMFGVTVDYIITDGHDALPSAEDVENKLMLARKKTRAHSMITGMSVVLVWIIALTVFFTIDLSFEGVKGHWLALVYAPCVSAVVWLVLNSIWFNRRRNYPIITLLMWTLIIAVHVTVIMFGSMDLWQLYVLGIPGQIVIILWSMMFKKPKNK